MSLYQDTVFYSNLQSHSSEYEFSYFSADCICIWCIFQSSEWHLYLWGSSGHWFAWILKIAHWWLQCHGMNLLFYWSLVWVLSFWNILQVMVMMMIWPISYNLIKLNYFILNLKMKTTIFEVLQASSSNEMCIMSLRQTYLSNEMCMFSWFIPLIAIFPDVNTYPRSSTFGHLPWCLGCSLCIDGIHDSHWPLLCSSKWGSSSIHGCISHGINLLVTYMVLWGLHLCEYGMKWLSGWFMGGALLIYWLRSCDNGLS